MSFRLEFPVVERASVWKEARLGNSFTMREYNAVRYHNLVGNSGNVVDMHTLYELCEELRRDVVEDYDFSVSPSDSGYCYLEYIQKEYWAYVAELLGEGPSAADVLKAATLVPADCGTVSLLKSDTGWHAKRDVKAEVRGWVKALSAEDRQRLKVGAAVMKFVPGKGLQVEQVLPDSWFGGPRLAPLQRLAVVEPMAVVGGGVALVPEVKAGAPGSGHAFDSVAGETFSVETPEGYLNCGSECRLGAECMFVHVRDGFLNGCPVHRIGKAVWQGDGKVSHDDRQAARQAAVYCVDRREVAMREYKGVSLSVYKECYQTCMLPKFMGVTYGTRVREYSGSDGDSDYGDEDDEIVGGYREIYSRLVKRRPPIKVSSDYLREYRKVVDYWLEPAGLESSRISDADLLRLLLDEKFRLQWAKTGPGERGADVALALARRIRVATMPGLMLGAGRSEDPMGLMVQLGMAVLWLVTSRLAHG